MKKFLIFVALAMVFILLTSGLAIGRKAAEDEPAETSDVTTATTVATTAAPLPDGYEESVYYIAKGRPVVSEEMKDTGFEHVPAFFYFDGKTYFCILLNHTLSANQNGMITFDAGADSFEGYDTFFWTTHDMKTFIKHEADQAIFADAAPEYDTYGYVILVYLEVPEILDPAEADRMRSNMEVDLSYSILYSPDETEGPSADVTTEATTETTTAPPQVDVPWPEGPGAE